MWSIKKFPGIFLDLKISKGEDPYKVEFFMISNSKINLSNESGSLCGCEKWYRLLKLDDQSRIIADFSEK